MNLSKEQHHHLFLAEAVPRRAQGLPVTSATEGTRLSHQQGRDTAELPAWAAKKKGEAPHRALREASAEVTRPRLDLFVDSPPQRAIPSPRGADKAALPVTAHRRVCPSHPSREQSDFACCSHHKEEVTAVCKVHREGRKLGSKRNAICCHEMVRISYFRSQT